MKEAESGPAAPPRRHPLRPPCTTRRLATVAAVVTATAAAACAAPASDASFDTSRIAAEVEAAVWAFHAADTARDADAVLSLLWPEYEMRADGEHTDYETVSAAIPQFMSGLETFHTVWTDVRVKPLTADLAVSSFLFRDSLVAFDGTITRSRGPTTFVWERREGEWRVLFGDSDHYPIDPQ